MASGIKVYFILLLFLTGCTINNHTVYQQPTRFANNHWSVECIDNKFYIVSEVEGKRYTGLNCDYQYQGE